MYQKALRRVSPGIQLNQREGGKAGFFVWYEVHTIALAVLSHYSRLGRLRNQASGWACHGLRDLGLSSEGPRQETGATLVHGKALHLHDTLNVPSPGPAESTNRAYLVQETCRQPRGEGCGGKGDMSPC